MRILVTGATGLIGAAVVARLVETGHHVTGVARRVDAFRQRWPQSRWIAMDIGAAVEPEDWLPLLDGIEAVVNCAGVFQDGPQDSVRAVHLLGASALFAACERAGVRRVVHISAIGVDAFGPTRFAQSKHAGDAPLTRRGLEWVILRPGVVVGRAAYGGSALFRGLAALPIMPVMPGTQPVQIVQLGEIVETVLFALRPGAPARLSLDLAAPERLSFEEVVGQYRRWLGWPPARPWPVSDGLARLTFQLGDFAGWLGWRAPIRSTARLEVARGTTGDPAQWMRLTGIKPRNLAEALDAEPASVQERWFARLYMLKPVLFTALSLFWIMTGLICLGPGYGAGVGLMLQGGAGALAGPMVIAGALADIAIGLAIAFRLTSRMGLYAALGIMAFYMLAATVILPGLWIDPLGRLLKVLPIVVTHLIALAILEDR